MGCAFYAAPCRRGRPSLGVSRPGIFSKKMKQGRGDPRYHKRPALPQPPLGGGEGPVVCGPLFPAPRGAAEQGPRLAAEGGG